MANQGKTFKQKLNFILSPVDNHLEEHHTFEVFSIILIILNVLAVVLETVPWIHEEYSTAFLIFEIFSVAIFTLEYIGRIWTADINSHFQGSSHPRIRYLFSFMAVVDLISILPFYLPMITQFDLRVLRAIRLFRIFRVLKIGHYSEALQVFARVFRAKKIELLVTVFAASILMVIASTVMHFAEHHAQPHAFESIPKAMWWAVATLTTIGYGDVYPITTAGRFLTGIFSILGIGLFAIPAGILGSGFYEDIRTRRNKNKAVCPHCNKDIY